MLKVPTPHIEAKKEDVAKIVIMPGDPLRAKMIASTYLEDVKLVNQVRGMLGYTGNYKGNRVTVIGSGMGAASMGIYSYELFAGYDVDVIIRVGTAGGLLDELEVGDLVIGQAACTNSNYASQFKLNGSYCPICDFDTLLAVYFEGVKRGFNVKVGNLLTSDTFYSADEDEMKRWRSVGVLAVEMEAAALYMNAMQTGKKALAVCTISDLPFKGEAMNSYQRQNTLHNMIETVLESLVAKDKL